MATKIQLIHPAGKKAVRMEDAKYEIIKKYLLQYLNSKGEATQNELQNSVEGAFKKDHVIFEGTIGWHTEWVKLDLEARGIIKRHADRNPATYSMA
ncbi:MAG: hypothetical protein MUO53_11195 [Maribacter sp.]|nr:hypothetical protein [Maribacter sp.]